MNGDDIKLKATIKEKCKKELGNTDGFYNGEWMVTILDKRMRTVDLSNGRVSIMRNFDEVDIVIVND